MEYGYDTEDFHAFHVPLAPARSASKTEVLNAKVMFTKVVAENMDRNHPITDVKATATLGVAQAVAKKAFDLACW